MQLIKSNQSIDFFIESYCYTFPLGRATWTKHVRNGVELPEIVRDDNYDFNFQVNELVNASLSPL